MLDVKYEELKHASTKSALHFFLDASKGFRWMFVFNIVYSFLLSLSKIWVMVVFAKLVDYFSSITIEEFSWNYVMFYVL